LEGRDCSGKRKTSRELSPIDWLALEHSPIIERRDIPAKGLGEGTSAVTYVKQSEEQYPSLNDMSDEIIEFGSMTPGYRQVIYQSRLLSHQAHLQTEILLSTEGSRENSQPIRFIHQTLGLTIVGKAFNLGYWNTPKTYHLDLHLKARYTSPSGRPSSTTP